MTERCEYLPRQSFNSANFANTTTWHTLATLAGAAIIYKIVNNSGVDVDVSVDGGTTSHDVVPANSFVLYDIRTNRRKDEQFAIKNLTVFSVKALTGETVPGTGLIYFITMRETP
jgi:hypothetical protein